jgi:type II secretion system protein N
MFRAHYPQTDAELPRSLIVVGVPCVGVLLIAFFLIHGFPYDELGQRIASRIEESHGIQITFGDIGPTLQLAGPALEATQLRVKRPDRPPEPIERALIRPAWSMSWFAGEPALHVELESAAGTAVGTLQWNGTTRWAGSLHDARPELPPISDWIPTGRLEGMLVATVDLSMTELGPEGTVAFEVRDGTLFLPGLPSAPLQFETLTGELSIGGDAYAKLESLQFEGPLAKGSGSGKIGRAARLDQAPIAFEFDFVVQPELARAVAAGGVQVNPGGDAVAKISGTVAKPKIR